MCIVPKNFLAAGFLLAFAACPSWAQTGAASFMPGEPELAIGGISGSAISLNAAQLFNGAVGAEGFLGVALTKHLSIGFVIGYDGYSFQNKLSNTVVQNLEAGGVSPAEAAQLNVGVSGGLRYVPLMLEIKGVLYNNVSFRPYLLLGVGIAYNTCTSTITVNYNGNTLTSTGTASETDLLLAPGLGLLYSLGENVDFFVQFRLDMDFTTNQNTDTGTYTLTSGGGTYTTTALTDLTGDSPTFFIPFEAGLDFNL